MTEAWDHEPIGHVEAVAPLPPRYVTNKAFEKARKGLNPNMRAALQELIDLYRRRGDERPVAITVRQLAGACQMSRMAACRAIAGLVEKGFMVVVERKQAPKTLPLTTKMIVEVPTSRITESPTPLMRP